MAKEHLGSNSFEVMRLQKQLDETRAMLRYVCGEVGDNDWPDTLHLADVVEKHLFRHVADCKEPPQQVPTS